MLSLLAVRSERANRKEIGALVEKTFWPSWRLRRKKPKNGRIKKVQRGKSCRWSESHPGPKPKRKSKVQLIFPRLLTPLVFVGLPYFCLAADSSRKDLAIGLTVGLALGGAELVGGEVAVGFSGCSLWKVLTSLQRCWMADAGSQIFSSSG